MLNFKTLLSVLVAFSVWSCSNSGGSSDPIKYGSDSDFKSISGSLSEMTRIHQGLKNPSKSKTAQSVLGRNLIQRSLGETGESTPTPKKTEKTIEKIQKEINENDCHISEYDGSKKNQATKPNQPSQNGIDFDLSEIPEYTFKLTGDSCPVYIEATVKPDPNNKTQANIIMIMKITPELGEDYDVSELHLKGTFSMNPEQTETYIKAEFGGGFEGFAISKKYGRIEPYFGVTGMFEMNFSGQGMEQPMPPGQGDFSLPMTIKMGEIKGYRNNGNAYELKKSISMTPNSMEQLFFVNGRKVEEKEFTEFDKDFKIPGFDTIKFPGGDNSGPGSASNLKCTYEVYETDLSEAEFKAKIGDLYPIIRATSCEGSVIADQKRDGFNFNFYFKPQKDESTMVMMSYSNVNNPDESGSHSDTVNVEESRDVVQKVSPQIGIHLICLPQTPCTAPF